MQKSQSNRVVRNWRLTLIAYIGGLLVFGLPMWDTAWAQLQPSGTFGWHEPWRLLLGHWVHASWTHFLLNLVALVGWLLLWSESPLARLGELVCLSIVVGGAVNCFVDFSYVLGLSGLLHALFCASAVQGLSRAQARPMSIGVLLLLTAKVGYEQLVGALPSSELFAGLPVAVDAHLIGVIAGVVYGSAYTTIRGRVGHYLAN